MKHSFIAMNMAPKGQNGGNAAPVVNIAKDAPAPETTPEPAKDAPATEPEQEPAKEEEFTSAILTELKTAEDALYDQLMAAGPKTPAGRKINLQIWANQQAQEKEILEIKKAKHQALLDEKRSAKIAAVDSMIAAAIANYVAQEKLDAIPMDARKPEDIAAANEATAKFAGLREPIVNELLGSLPRVASGTAKTGTTGKGGTSAEIKELIAPMYVGATSATVAEVGRAVRKFIITEKGYNDGTANGVILAYEKELGLKS